MGWRFFFASEPLAPSDIVESMKTVLMAVAVVKDGDKVLLRKMDPAKNPYQQPWALFGGRIEDDGSIVDWTRRRLPAMMGK